MSNKNEGPNTIEMRDAAYKAWVKYANELEAQYLEALKKFDATDPTGAAGESWLMSHLNNAVRNINDFGPTGFEAQALVGFIPRLLEERLLRKSWEARGAVKALGPQLSNPDEMNYGQHAVSLAGNQKK